MDPVEITVPASAEETFTVLADGWLYALWVVGASHIRDVDEGWPAVGTRIHHSVGPWPMTLSDTTKVRDVDEPRMLELEARLWPVGSALIRLELTEIGPHSTRVTMFERAISGPVSLVPGAVQQMALTPRNKESLSRLADLVAGRAREGKAQ
ncbi:polyketide cyclase/dehydrase/lipid transport protein [Nocardia tenerifensis]|uniref:Polyketide cyclase/dehydrase/lipid transport protein n=1 Tax=Nocardia tenerifensis TaxID=228006 RepID=A0A318KA71_9NOCA|nr:SRPBCC family protein [Nocardia tenerifensis]PXX68622.1 polyketide cyclase/dehydrase/lipid transport protein [Nocardia tenerifensis]